MSRNPAQFLFILLCTLLLLPEDTLWAQNTRDQQLQQLKDISKGRTERHLQELRQVQEDEEVQLPVDSLLAEIKSKMVGQVVGLNGDKMTIFESRKASMMASKTN